MSYFKKIELKSLVDTANSTTTPLLANATFMGEWVDTSIYGTATIGVIADKDSAIDGLCICYSANGTDIVQTDKFTILANNGKTFSVGMANRYMRISYTNGTVAQTSLNIQTILKNASIKNSSHRINDPIVGEDDAELIKSVITGERDDNTFGNAVLDNENNLRVNSFPYTYSIAENAITGHTSLLKFGTRTNITANTQSTIWEGPTALYTYLSTAEQLKVSSSSANDTALGTGVRTVTLYGLDSNFLEINETITMNGTGVLTTTNSFIRIYRVICATCGTSLTNEGNITITNNAGTVTLVYIPSGDGQTLMTIWTVPSNKVAYLTQISTSTDSNKGARFSLYTRLNDGGILYPWQIKYRAYLFGGNNIVPFTIPFKIPPKTDIEIRFTTPASAGTTSGGATFELWYEDL